MNFVVQSVCFATLKIWFLDYQQHSTWVALHHNKDKVII